MAAPCMWRWRLGTLDIMSSKSSVRVDTVSSVLEAAHRLLKRGGAADLTMAEIAGEAGISRQAVYLHFADRTELLVRLAQYVDEKRRLGEELAKVDAAGSGVEALKVMASLQ